MNIVKIKVLIVMASVSLIMLTAYRIHEESPSSNVGTDHMVADSARVQKIAAPGIDPELYKELKRIFSHYEKLNVEISGIINYYEDAYSAAQLREKQQFAFSFAGQNSLYEIDSVMTLVSGRRCLVIDKKEKTVSLFESDQKGAEVRVSVQRMMLNIIEGYKDYINDIRLRTLSDNLKEMEISFVDEMEGGLEKYAIQYDARSYAIKKIRMEMSEPEINDSGELGADSTLTDEDELVLVDSLNNETPTGYFASFSKRIFEIVYKSERTISREKLDMTQFIRELNQDEFEPVGKYKNYTILF